MIRLTAHRETTIDCGISPLETEIEPCLPTKNARAQLHSRRRWHPTPPLHTRKNTLVGILGLCIVVMCVLGEFYRRNNLVPLPFASIEEEKNFMNTIAEEYGRINRIQACSTSQRKCEGSMIFSLHCDDGVANVLVKRYLTHFHPTLICGSTTSKSQSTSLQAIFDLKYDMLLLDDESYHQYHDFWETMLLPDGILFVYSGAQLTLSKSVDNAQENTDMFKILPLTSKDEVDDFFNRVAHEYKKCICNPLNKNGLFCSGKIFSHDCQNGLSSQLVEKYLTGQSTLVCVDRHSRPQTDATQRFQQSVSIEELIQGRYQAILLDSSNHFPANLKLWNHLLAPGGIIAIPGRLNVNQTVFDQFLYSLKLGLKDRSSDPMIILANTDLPKDDGNPVKQHESVVETSYEPNEGSVDNQIQLSPMSKEDRYPSIYRTVAVELLSGSTCSNDKTRRSGNPSCPLKVLSFGCSYGFEMKSLADKYLTGKADIYGVDLNEPVIERARENVKVVQTNKMVVLNGKTDPAYNYGPFDAVFANSVLCYNKFPEPDDPVADIRKMFPFQVFEELLGDIDRLVKVGGLLSLDNANYQFHETELFRNKYQIYGEDDTPLCRQEVWLLAADGHKVIFNPHTGNRGAYTVRCLFVKVNE